MFTTVSVTLPTTTLLALITQLQRRGGSQDLSEGIAAAVDFWLADQNKFPNQADPSGLHGYQWKSLFLPEGTVLRSWSYGEHNYARVEGDHIMHDGRAVSPNQFARAFARTTRNAWTDLYVRRPGDPSFKLACALRRELAREAEAKRQPPPASLPATPPAAPSMPATAPEPPEPSPAHGLANLRRDTIMRADPDPGPGWNLPERRKFRFRIEDVAFD